jgi:hypothetical protein
MDDPRNIPLGGPHEKAPGPNAGQVPDTVLEPSAAFDGRVAPEWTSSYAAVPAGGDASRRRSMRQSLLLLLFLTLAAFAFTTWIFVRMDSPFGIFSTGPQKVVRAQLLALDRGELRPAYDMFSARYRQQISFDLWHELVVTHWRMFHAEVLRAGKPAKAGPCVTLEIHLRGADEKDYRARFTLIRTEGRWWIDDLHWAEEYDEHETLRT